MLEAVKAALLAAAEDPVLHATVGAEDPTEPNTRKMWTTDEITVIEFGQNALPGLSSQLTVEVGQSFDFNGFHLERTGHGITDETKSRLRSGSTARRSP